MALDRIFAAVPLPGEIRMALHDRLAPFDLPGRVVPPENWHVTLRFLGGIEEVAYERFVHALTSRDLGEPFPLELTGLGAFPRPAKATVLWIGLGGEIGRLEDLAEIADDSADAAGLSAEDRPFRPHLTLSRIRPPVDVGDLIDNASRWHLGWTCREIVVYRSILGSGGARYEPLEIVELT